jgi:hypothetical protein
VLQLDEELLVAGCPACSLLHPILSLLAGARSP